MRCGIRLMNDRVRKPDDAADQNTVPPLRELRVVVDSTLPRDEIRCHPAAFDLLQRAILEADLIRHPDGSWEYDP